MAGSFPAPTFADASGRSAIPATATAAISDPTRIEGWRPDRPAPADEGCKWGAVGDRLICGGFCARLCGAPGGGFEKMDYGAP